MNVLVIVDVQNDFVNGSLGTPEAQQIVPKVIDLVKGWKGDIYYTYDTHDESYLKTHEGINLPVKHCIKGTIVKMLIFYVANEIKFLICN